MWSVRKAAALLLPAVSEAVGPECRKGPLLDVVVALQVSHRWQCGFRLPLPTQCAMHDNGSLLRARRQTVHELSLLTASPSAPSPPPPPQKDVSAWVRKAVKGILAQVAVGLGSADVPAALVKDFRRMASHHDREVNLACAHDFPAMACALGPAR